MSSADQKAEFSKEEIERRRAMLEPPELKNCPFCGGVARISCHVDHAGYIDGAFVKCDQCGAQSRWFSSRGSPYMLEYSLNTYTGTANLLAAAAWNARPGEGTFQCPECGVGVPHRHEEVAGRDRWDRRIKIVPIASAESASTDGKKEQA